MRRFDTVGLEIGQQILRAPFDDNGWDKALKSLASYTRSSRAELVVFGGNNSVPFNWMTDLSEEAHREFLEIDGGNPEVNIRVAAAKSAFEISHEADYDAVRPHLRCEAYDEYAHRHDITYGCQTVLAQGKQSLVGLAVLRGERDGRTTIEDREAFASLAPYVLNAVQFQQSIKHQGALMIAGSFDAMSRVAFILDGAQIVRAQSEAAAALMRADRRLSVNQGRLTASAPEDDRKLQAAVHRAMEARDTGTVDRSQILLRGEGPLDTLIAEVFPLPPQEWAFGFEPRVVVVARELAAPQFEQRHILADMLGLTSAEADIAILAARGLSREQIARERGTSLETVGSQMKSLYRKSDVNREAELVAFLHRLLR